MSGHVALIVIDMQLGVFKSPIIPPVAGDKQLLSIVTRLISKARAASVPIIYVQHNGGKGHPLERGTPGWKIHPDISPSANDVVIEKGTPDSFYGTQLQKELESQNIKRLVVCGIQTEFCVDMTCRRAFSLGYQVILAKDAHSTWDTDLLSASQIIAHHNNVLAEWFVKTKEVSEIDFDTLLGNGGYQVSRLHSKGETAMVTRKTTQPRNILEGSAAEVSAFLQNILGSSTEYSIIGKDLEGNILLWNEGARLLYGYEPDEVVGKKNSSILRPPEDVKARKPQGMMDTAIREGKWEGTIARIRKDGGRFTARVVITPRYDPAGEPVGFLLISKDISKEVQFTETIRKTKLFDSAIVANAQDAVDFITNILESSTEVASAMRGDSRSLREDRTSLRSVNRPGAWQ